MAGHCLLILTVFIMLCMYLTLKTDMLINICREMCPRELVKDLDSYLVNECIFHFSKRLNGFGGY